MRGRAHPITGKGPSPQWEGSDAPDKALSHCALCPPAERLMSRLHRGLMGIQQSHQQCLGTRKEEVQKASLESWLRVQT